MAIAVLVVLGIVFRSIFAHIGVANGLDAMIHVHEALGTARLTRNDAIGIILPNGCIEADNGRSVRCNIPDRFPFVLFVAVTPGSVGVTDALRGGVSIALDRSISRVLGTVRRTNRLLVRLHSVITDKEYWCENLISSSS